ncbi:hypothetical protein [Lysinibacillus capsici]|uniref:hypothetical protein n=1 Tax=Lysinibacillus capsici TaxID=2115968 RepID=UPI00289A03C8|nr:hypothetical protein [Lysinibacillus capsici]
MTNKQAILIEQVHVVKDFLVHYTSYRVLHQNFDELGNMGSREFWVHTINSHFYQAINLWSMVFGVNNKETHWKLLELPDDLKPRILADLDTDEKDYNDYWGKIREWRNKYSAHRVPGFLPETPDLKRARSIVFSYEKWLKDHDLIDFSFSEYEYKFCQEVENTIREILK